MPTKLFLLIAEHFVGDFILQPEAVAVEKNRHSATPLQQAVPWFYWLVAHALTHGTLVWLITRSLPLAMAESVAHFLIDFGKCEKWYGIHVDQFLHLTCKALWWAL